MGKATPMGKTVSQWVLSRGSFLNCFGRSRLTQKFTFLFALFFDREIGRLCLGLSGFTWDSNTLPNVSASRQG
jgi:hypothetical protein